ncbi:galactitol-1-phosphate 5-dehydrogenase [bacterium]|nr:MAG: galactitol-1-phosphate 5-dehydrogenase [bacterium]
MRALQLVEYGRFELKDLPRPQPKEDEVLIRVSVCGICGSDVHGMDGSTGRRLPPIVMGHEAAGEIMEIGAAVEGWKIGDRVTFDSTVYCGRCPYCLRGEINLCDNRKVLGVSTPEFRMDGAYAEYVAVPARILYRLPDNLSYEHAAMVEPVSIANHAVNRAGDVSGKATAVIGAGMIGLLIVQMLKVRGAASIVAIDLDEEKLTLARKLGATATTFDGPVDVAIEAVGIQPTINAAIENTRKGGKIVLVGNLSPRVEVPLQAIVSRELDVLGSAACCGEYPDSLQMIADGRIQVDPLISGHSTLDEAAHWFDRLYKGEKGLMKVMVCP